MTTRSYSTVIYKHPRGMFVAQCPAIPSASGEGGTVQEARDNLVADIQEAHRHGEAEREDEAVITSLSVTAVIGSPIHNKAFTNVHTYTVIVSPDTHGYTSFCPALGVASLGDTVDEALAMLADAMHAQGEVERLPDWDTRVTVGSLQVNVARVGSAHATLA